MVGVFFFALCVCSIFPPYVGYHDCLFPFFSCLDMAARQLYTRTHSNLGGVVHFPIIIFYYFLLLFISLFFFILVS